MVVLTLHLPYTSIHLFLMPLGVGGFSYLSSLKKTFPLPKLQPLNPHWKPTAPMRAVTLVNGKEKTQFSKGKGNLFYECITSCVGSHS